MATYTLITDVGLSLVKVLRESLVPELIAHPDGVGLAHPAERGDMNLTLYLYNIQENADYRSNDMVQEGESLRYPSIPLDLSYLITAHSFSDVVSRSIDEHRIIGKTLQVFHDHNTLREADLVGSLEGSGESFRIVKEEMPLDTAISFFPDMPYKLSLSYTVGPVFLQSTKTKPISRVRERKVQTTQK